MRTLSYLPESLCRGDRRENVIVSFPFPLSSTHTETERARERDFTSINLTLFSPIDLSLVTATFHTFPLVYGANVMHPPLASAGNNVCCRAHNMLLWSHSKQGSPNWWEPVRFDRLPVKPVRSGSGSGRYPTGQNSNFKFEFKKWKIPKKFLKILQGVMNLMM